MRLRRLAVAVTLLLSLSATAGAIAAVSPPALRGKYAATVTSISHKRTVKVRWVLNFLGRTGRMAVTMNGKSVGSDAFSLKNSTLTLSAASSCHGSATYGFKLTGKKLKFTRIHDGCTGRRTLLSYTYTKIS